MKTEVVQIITRRSLTSAPASVVYAHEVPILKIAHGEGSIEVTATGCTEFMLKPTNVAPRDEFVRLKQKYRGFTREGQNPVDIAYPDGSSDLELFYKDPSTFGEPATKSEPEDQIITVTEPEPNSGTTAVGAIEHRADVIAQLNELDVPFAKTLNTKSLEALLDKTLAKESSD